MVGALLLCGYVPPPSKVLEGWLHSRPSVAATPVVVPVRWEGIPGALYVGGPGHNALSAEGVPTAYDQGSGAAAQPLAALWRALDLWSVSGPEELDTTLAAAGVDLARSGLARSRWTQGGVAITVGARGEGEPLLPQFWVGREDRWPCRFILAGGAAVTIGPRGAAGWPGWILVGEDRLLEVTGPPTAAPAPPEWAVRPTGATGERFPEDWRRAFGEPEP